MLYVFRQGNTLGTRINGPCARTLDLPLLVRSGVFFFFFGLERVDFWCVFDLFSRGGNLGLHTTQGPLFEFLRYDR